MTPGQSASVGVPKSLDYVVFATTLSWNVLT
jgi:hypothetical protein